jgi:uncharacterized membrane protein YccC
MTTAQPVSVDGGVHAIGNAARRAAVAAISSAVTFALTTHLLAMLYSASREDDLLGGMWAVVATLFVYRHSHGETIEAALSRMMATLVSFGLCFVYLLIFPFHLWGMALLIGIGVVIVASMGRPQDAMTSSITTTVVLVVAAVNPHHAWREPILRLIDTAIGAGIGVAAAWIYPPDAGFRWKSQTMHT